MKVVVFFILIQLSGALLFASEQLISLQEVLNGYREHNQTIRRLSAEQKVVQSQKKQTDEAGIKHKIISQIALSKNELSDSRDLDASASETTQMSLTYQQIFEEGFNWSISHKNRVSSPIDSSGDKEDFTKYILSTELPIYGKQAGGRKLENQKKVVQIHQKEERLSGEKRKLIHTVATLYFDYLEAFQRKALETQKAVNLQKKIEWARERALNFTEFHSKELELELLLGQQSLSEAIVAFQKSYYSLKQQVHFLEKNRVPAFVKVPQVKITAQEFEKRYITFSQKVIQVKQQIELDHRQLELISLEKEPAVYLGSFFGNTRSLQSDDSYQRGTNYGAFLKFSYSFGGGEQEAVWAEQQNLEKNKLYLKEIERAVKGEAQLDYNTMNSYLKGVLLAEKKKTLIWSQLNLASEKYMAGQLTRADVLDYQIRLDESVLFYNEAVIRFWKHFSSMAYKANLDLSRFL